MYVHLTLYLYIYTAYFISFIPCITNIRKLYQLPKIHKRLENVLGRPVMFNYDTPTEKVSEFLDYHL